MTSLKLRNLVTKESQGTLGRRQLLLGALALSLATILPGSERAAGSAARSSIPSVYGATGAMHDSWYDYGRVFTPDARTGAAVQWAIDEANAAGGGSVQ